MSLIQLETHRQREKCTVCQWAEWLFTMNNESLMQQNIFASLDQIKKVWVRWVVEKTIWWISWCNCRLERQNKPLQQNCCVKSTFRFTAYKMKKRDSIPAHLSGSWNGMDTICLLLFYWANHQNTRISESVKNAPQIWLTINPWRSQGVGQLGL